ncbi:MAG: cytochrome c maturation protein CcmE [Candidatus Binatia bacterium]
MKRSAKFGIGACLLVAAIGYLMVAGLQTSSSYYFTIGEFLPQRDRFAGQGVRIAGRVNEGSLRKHTSVQGTSLEFAIGDFAGPDRQPLAGTLPVTYVGVVPDMFAEGRDVIIEGRYVDGVLRAQTIMTSCPSKYEPDVGEEAGAPQQAAQR